MSDIEVIVEQVSMEVDIQEQPIEIEISGVIVAPSDKDISLVAGEAIGGHKLVAVIDGKAYLADKDNSDHYGRVVGMSVTAASEGSVVKIRQQGVVRLEGWGLDSGEAYKVGTSGQLAQVSISGFFQVAGVAKSDNELIVKLSEPYRRA